MLHENPLMADIDVNHWRNMQSLLLESGKGKRKIIVIHEKGQILKFIHSERAEIVKNVDFVDDPARVAREVYEANPGKADFVLVIERRMLEQYFGAVQDSWKASEDLDVYVNRMFAMLDEYPQAVATYPHEASYNLGLQWRVGSSYEDLQAFIAKYIPANTTVVFGIFDQDVLWASLVLGFNQDKRIDNVTTVDPTELGKLQGWKDVSREIVGWVNGKYTSCSLGLFTDLETAKQLLSTAQKAAVIHQAVANDRLFAAPVPGNIQQWMK
jgi:hypothetical protein